VRLLSNPIVLRMALLLVTAAFGCMLGIWAMRRLRRSLSEGDSLSDSPTSAEQFPLHTYHAVIQQLKQQKHELLSEQQMERRRAKTSENISVAVLSNLSSGVMFLTPNGLIRQANTAAKNILGFASPVGLSAEQIFRDASLISASGEKLSQVVQASLRDQTTCRRWEARYLTPAGEQRMLEIAMTAVHTPGGDVLGAACLINDKTEMATIRKQQELRGEMSAEMALALRNSLATISGYAQQLAASRDPDLARQLATDIASEAAQLDHTIGGFLAGARANAARA
jgi:nitrogen fixation/metabolism regulation signal transduction histidine kinase